MCVDAIPYSFCDKSTYFKKYIYLVLVVLVLRTVYRVVETANTL